MGALGNGIFTDLQSSAPVGKAGGVSAPEWVFALALGTLCLIDQNYDHKIDHINDYVNPRSFK